LAYPEQCPKPARPDDRLNEEPCAFAALTTDMSDVEVEATMLANNKCARVIRARYTELQQWVRGRVQ